MSFVCCACEMLFIVLYWLLEFTARPPGMSKNVLTSYELMFLLWTVTIILTIKLALSYYLLIYTRLRVAIAIGLYIYMVGGLLFEWNILCLFSEHIDIWLCNLNYKFRRVLYKNVSNMTIATNKEHMTKTNSVLYNIHCRRISHSIQNITQLSIIFSVSNLLSFWTKEKAASLMHKSS